MFNKLLSVMIAYRAYFSLAFANMKGRCKSHVRLMHYFESTKRDHLILCLPVCNAL